MAFGPWRCNSDRTLASWRGVTNPANSLLTLFIGSTATLLVTVVVNPVTSANAPDKDYSSGYAMAHLDLIVS